jgi:hypothetical protein
VLMMLSDWWFGVRCWRTNHPGDKRFRVPPPEVTTPSDCSSFSVEPPDELPEEGPTASDSGPDPPLSFFSGWCMRPSGVGLSRADGGPARAMLQRRSKELGQRVSLAINRIEEAEDRHR